MNGIWKKIKRLVSIWVDVSRTWIGFWILPEEFMKGIDKYL